MIYYLVLLLAFSGFKCAFCFSDSYSEDLFIKPLQNDKIYTYFQFTTRWDVDPQVDNLDHTRLFPRAVSELIKRFNVQELHLTLTAGLWRYQTWGYPVKEAGPGAELWAWFHPDTKDVDKNWKDLSNFLSGLICASLNFVNEQTTISPAYSLRPSGIVKDQVNSSFLRFASLPREIVCTENLTPWKKLLPCDSTQGLASLLNSGYIHNTRYHSIGLHLRPICRTKECDLPSLELQQTVSLVYDSALLGTSDLSIRILFGQGILNKCPLAEASNVYVDTTSGATPSYNLVPEPDEVIKSTRGGYESQFAKYQVGNSPFNVAIVRLDKKNIAPSNPPPVYASQFKTGFGQQKGKLVTKLYNNHWTTIDVVILQNIPWYVPIYLHTLKIESNGKEIKPKAMKFNPGRLRQKPYCLELVLTLPARAATTIAINFDYVFLHWQEYPPDANHGMYIASSIISAILPHAKNFTGIPQDGSTISDSFNASRSGYFVQIRTETVIVNLPTPDFSMPYNVICLSCTVVALAFGPLHNTTTKRLVIKYMDAPMQKAGNLFQFLLGKVLAPVRGTATLQGSATTSSQAK